MKHILIFLLFSFSATAQITIPLKGQKGDQGVSGANGTNGVGVPSGGTSGQLLSKATGTDYDTEWIDAPEGGGGGPSITNGTVSTHNVTNSYTTLVTKAVTSGSKYRIIINGYWAASNTALYKQIQCSMPTSNIYIEYMFARDAFGDQPTTTVCTGTAQTTLNCNLAYSQSTTSAGPWKAVVWLFPSSSGTFDFQVRMNAGTGTISNTWYVIEEF